MAYLDGLKHAGLQDLAHAVERGDADSIAGDEALAMFRSVTERIPLGELQTCATEALGLMPAAERRALVQLLKKRAHEEGFNAPTFARSDAEEPHELAIALLHLHRKDPGHLPHLLGTPELVRQPLVKKLLAGIAAFAIRREEERMVRRPPGR